VRNGLLLVDKQTDCTSHDVVQEARRLLRQRKIGHCGTLDPDATGLLVLTLGKATRLTRFLINAPKVYGGTIRFGASTDTYDASGEITATGSVEDLTLERVEHCMRQFEGQIEQAAPPFSAKKVGGVKYYELARRGQEVPKATKNITVFEFAPAGELDAERLDFRLACSSGTYVRSLAHELGAKLGCGAHLERLRRLTVGPFSVEKSSTLDEIERQLADLSPDELECWVSFDEIPLPFSEVITDAQQTRRLLHGQTVLLREGDLGEGDWVKLVDQRRRLVAVGSVVESIGSGNVAVVRPRIVFQ
jgi:tRNA pseudouridine55 synthase